MALGRKLVAHLKAVWEGEGQHADGPHDRHAADLHAEHHAPEESPPAKADKGLLGWLRRTLE